MLFTDLDRDDDDESELPWFADEDKETVARSRSGLFLSSHTLTSLLVLYPSLALVTILVTRARVLDTLDINIQHHGHLPDLLRVPPRPRPHPRPLHPHREAIPTS